MDDILLLVPNQIYEILLNRLKFTVEHNDDSSVNFLNVSLTIKDQIKQLQLRNLRILDVI